MSTNRFSGPVDQAAHPGAVVPARMNAMALTRRGVGRVDSLSVTVPVAGCGEVLVRVHACGVCRTDLHVVDGELPHRAVPIIPGHEIVGTVVRVGPGVAELRCGDRVGIPWLASTCGRCDDCRSGAENLCNHALFTGYDVDGGYAEFVVADSRRGGLGR